MQISMKFQLKLIGNPVEISMKYQWKSIGNPDAISMKYQWKSIGNSQKNQKLETENLKFNWKFKWTFEIHEITMKIELSFQ